MQQVVQLLREASASLRLLGDEQPDVPAFTAHLQTFYQLLSSIRAEFRDASSSMVGIPGDSVAISNTYLKEKDFEILAGAAELARSELAAIHSLIPAEYSNSLAA